MPTAPALASLFPTGAPTADDLERFLGAALHAGGEWSSPREGDGVLSHRCLDGTDDTISVWGVIYTIDQALHLFWLELEGSGDDVRWTLSYDVAGLSARKVRNVFDAGNDPSTLSWSVVLTGCAVSDGGALRPVVGA